MRRITVKPFIFTVESPSHEEFYKGITEGRALTQMLDVAGISQSYSIATSLEYFNECIDTRLGEAIKAHNKYPIIHLSLHGNSNEIGFTNGDRLNWAGLRIKLLPLIRVMNGGLIISMSSCFGVSGCRMAMHTDNEPTFYALIGNNIKISVPDAALAYATFYSLFFKGVEIESCVKAMKIASNNTEFEMHYGAKTKEDYAKYINEQSIQGLLQKLGVS